MNKKYLRLILSFTAFGLLLGVVAPWGIGHFIYKASVNRIEQSNATNAHFGIVLKLKNYQKGIYRSFATIEMVQKPIGTLTSESEKENSILQVFFEESIQHGPIILDIHAKKIDFGLAKIKSQISWPETAMLKIDQKNLVIDSIVNYFGKQTALVYIDKISGSIPKKFFNNAIHKDTFFELNNIKLDFSCYLSDLFPTYNMTIEDSQIKTEKSNFELKGLTIKSNVATLAASDINYSSTISLDKLESLEPRFLANNLSFQLKGSRINGNHSYEAETNFKEVVVDGVIYGPGELNYSLEGISDKFLHEFFSLNQNLSPEASTQAVKQLFQANNLELKLNLKKFKLNLPDGTLSLQSALCLKSSETENDIAITGKLGLAFSKKIAFNLAKKITGKDDPLEHLPFLTHGGFLIDTGEQYETYLLYKNGQLYRNGVPDIEKVNAYIDSFPSFKRPFSADKELLVAIWLNDIETVKTLLKQGINLNSVSEDIKNPLSVAAFMGNEALVDLLLQHKISVNQIDRMGNTALSLAARSGNVHIVQSLLTHGAEPDISNSKGWTPLQEAAENGHLVVVELLLQQKIEINKADKENRTALFWAAQKGHDKIVELLLNKGANPAIASIRGTTPRDIAQYNGHTSTVAILDNFH